MLRTLALTTLLLPALVHAGEAPRAPIWNGTEAAPCDWPSVVQMDDSCTGTLVHPEVVIYAGHCGPDYGNVFFGEGGDNVAFAVAVEYCVASAFDFGHDYAVCKLAEPVLNVPIVPILMGCETDALQVGTTVTMIGFGEAEEPKPYGIKRVAHAVIQEFADNEVFIQSDDGMDTCFGDSGGPVMIQLGDGTWRVFGITSYGLTDECGSGTWYSMMHIDLKWFEDQVGIDITPCNTPDGEWDPGPDCGGFPEAPGTGVGAWDSCGPGPVGAMSQTCGPAFGAEQDLTAPLAEVLDPDDGLEFMSDGNLSLTIVGAARDAADKPEGWGIEQVRLVFNDQQIPDSERFVPPYEWNVELPTGQYLIQVLAVDNSGNEGLSAPTAIGVNKPVPEVPGPSDDTTGGSSSDSADDPTSDSGLEASSGDDGGDSSSTTAPPMDDDEGCGCAATSAPSGLALLLLLARRRRTR